MTEPTRKLAAIVFTDIVGFTKLTAKDQSKASGLIKQTFVGFFVCKDDG